MALAHHLAEDVADAFARLGEFARTGAVQIKGPVKEADGTLTASESYTNAVKDVEIARLFLAAYKLELDRVRPPSLITLNPSAMELSVKYMPQGFPPPLPPAPTALDLMREERDAALDEAVNLRHQLDALTAPKPEEVAAVTPPEPEAQAG